MSVVKQGGKHRFPNLMRVCCWDRDRSGTKLIFSWFVCLKNDIFVSECSEDMCLWKMGPSVKCATPLTQLFVCDWQWLKICQYISLLDHSDEEFESFLSIRWKKGWYFLDIWQIVLICTYCIVQCFWHIVKDQIPLWACSVSVLFRSEDLSFSWDVFQETVCQRELPLNTQPGKQKNVYALVLNGGKLHLLYFTGMKIKPLQEPFWQISVHSGSR